MAIVDEVLKFFVIVVIFIFVLLFLIDVVLGILELQQLISYNEDTPRLSVWGVFNLCAK